jgi:hypothetical protein
LELDVELLALVPSWPAAACRLARNDVKSFSSCVSSELVVEEVEEAEVAEVAAVVEAEVVEPLEVRSLTRVCRSVSSWPSNALRLVESVEEVDVESLEEVDAFVVDEVGGGPGDGPGGGPLGPPPSDALLEFDDEPLLSCVRKASSCDGRPTEPDASSEEDETPDDEEDDVELDCAKLSPWFDTLTSSRRNRDMVCCPIDERDMLTSISPF